MMNDSNIGITVKEKLRGWRDKLYRVGDRWGLVFFLAFYIPLFFLMSIGSGYTESLYGRIYPTCLVFFLLKMISTRYNKKQWIFLIVTAIWLATSLSINHREIYAFAVVTVLAAKDIKVKDLMMPLWFFRMVAIVMTMVFAWFGLIETNVVNLPKYVHREWTYPAINTLGFRQPNHTMFYVFFTCAVALILFVRKWPHSRWRFVLYVVLTATVFGFYEALISRTGWYVWCMLMVMILVYEAIRKNVLGKVYLNILAWMPMICLLGSTMLVILYVVANERFGFLNEMTTGRFGLLVNNTEFLPGWYKMLFFGVESANFVDMSYPSMVLSNGWIFTILVIALLCLGAKRMIILDENDPGEYAAGAFTVIVMAAMAIYAISENLPMNPANNMLLLLLAEPMYGFFKWKDDKREGACVK